jgi:hypothetical protein
MPLRPNQQLDNTAQRFLKAGSATAAPVQVHDGQKADDARLAAQHEQVLLSEACAYGDDLVRYVAMHQDLSPEEAAWGFCLGLYCARDAYPPGGDVFDDIADQARKDLVLAKTTVVTDQAEIERIQTELPEFTENQFTRSAAFAEDFANFLSRKKRQVGIANKQGVYGLGRAFHNLRQTFPKDRGGSAAFDELARRAGFYFADNKE